MRLRDRLRSLDPLGLLVLMWILLIGGLSAVVLLARLVTASGAPIRPDASGAALIGAATRLLIGIAAVAGFYVARRRQVPWVVRMWRQNSFLVLSLTSIVVAWSLEQVSDLVATLSVPVAGAIQVVEEMLFVLAAGLVLWGIKKGDVGWLHRS